MQQQQQQQQHVRTIPPGNRTPRAKYYSRLVFPRLFSPLFSPSWEPPFTGSLASSAVARKQRGDNGGEVGENWSGAPSKSRKLSCRLPDALRIFPENNFRHSGWRRLEKGRTAPGPREIRRENSRLVRDLKSGTSVPPRSRDCKQYDNDHSYYHPKREEFCTREEGEVDSLFESETGLINNANERTLRIELSAPRFKCVV